MKMNCKECKKEIYKYSEAFFNCSICDSPLHTKCFKTKKGDKLNLIFCSECLKTYKVIY